MLGVFFACVHHPCVRMKAAVISIICSTVLGVNWGEMGRSLVTTGRIATGPIGYK